MIKVLTEWLNVFLDCVLCGLLFWSLSIYISFYPWAPWRELDGLQFLTIIFFTTPVLWFVSLLFFIINKRKKSLLIVLTTLFIALPILVDRGLSGTLFYMGQIACAFMACCSVLIIVYDVWRLFLEKIKL